MIQVSPAKLALRRHLSQERLAAPGARTIGDLVNGEIERTLEISNQSIINATVNMSARYHEPVTAAPAAPSQQPLEGTDKFQNTIIILMRMSWNDYTSIILMFPLWYLKRCVEFPVSTKHVSKL